jgi:hypothetical protein
MIFAPVPQYFSVEKNEEAQPITENMSAVPLQIKRPLPF